MKTKQWFALRLKQGAARPYRHDERFTNIEWSLKREGIDYYMPMELAMKIHHRTKKSIDKRFPLIPGYAFMQAVLDDQDWKKVRECDFVASIIGIGGTPLPLPTAQIELIQMAETSLRELYEYHKALRAYEEEQRLRKVTRRVASEQFPAGGVVTISQQHRLFAGRRATIVAATGRNTIKAVIETLNGMANAEIPISLVEKVA
ncbi:transcription termination/antitermination NusG family protein [Rhizobium hidalgonense]|uniref:Transcription termination/antitermination NusG family protein n=1 Tax=Rhizobium hidalgonense TaxID=1538159 RepID=A0AAJ2H1H0_9HYPH|nr:transcription termination/antitermination NusG family protein [Rhizobium hidalgonense]MDR9777214.1 transcription termination/antitermination NusG family protein [Rhizobium hidalgonense]